MKFLVVFVLCFVALAAAAPQLIAPFNGLVDPFIPRTVIAGPTVLNRPGLLGGGLIAPGFGDYLCENC